MDNRAEIEYLFGRYLSGKYTVEELTALLHYFKIDKEGDRLKALIEKELNSPLDFSGNAGEIEEVGAYVRNSLNRKIHAVSKPRIPYLRIAAAIAALLLITLAVYFIGSHPGTTIPKTVTIGDIAPGTQKATLTLANGKTLILEGSANGLIAKETGISIAKTANGELVYSSAKNGNDLPPANPSSFNTLSTANGETYRVILPDGSKVWLNAGTTLQYSAVLRERGKRKVILVAGEAYFEITKDKKHPFVVATPTQEVEVLGTHFNINSYADEGKTVTTLEEGSVKVLPSDNSGKQKPIILKPGEQSLYADGHFQVREADLQTALAWKDGMMYFKKADLRTIMRQVARWYNIKVEFHGEVPRRLFTGGVSRNTSLSTLFRMFRFNDIHFTVEDHPQGRTLIITP
ncbi:FecR family protein [Chryseobacterium lathyri]|uniref:Iron dicitrate transporter FecR n=1 Tax=Chryseobacterium lathyri TaxID=395933 RepID=A0A511Y7J9_9FLAO|nr:FecR family protein [Chryseobacterium lathyri]GEN71170.1 hypothetical protein CLA01_12420 [Chryseobacterium lathyri]